MKYNIAIAPLIKTALKFSYFFFSLILNPIKPMPIIYPNIILVNGLIKSLSIEYLAPIPTPIIRIIIPILFIRFSPMNFSKLDFPFGFTIFLRIGLMAGSGVEVGDVKSFSSNGLLISSVSSKTLLVVLSTVGTIFSSIID